MKAARLEMPMVHVGGQVRDTGPVRWHPGMNLNQAIEGAGGPTEFGAMNRIELLRSGSVRNFDLRVEESRSFSVQENDTITIPEKVFIGR